MLTALALLFLAQPELPELTVTADNTHITTSCRVVIPVGTVFTDPDNNGVIHIDTDGITVEFAPGSILRGATEGTPWDTLTGTGVRTDGHRDVTIRNADVRGFKVGLYATDAHSLTIAGGNFADNFRQRLKSTPIAEDASDWLWPHANDGREWMTNYGGAVVVERSENVDISNVTVRHGQNGIILDRVEWSRVYDCDCSFLSGWGLAMWRSSWNTVSRNAFDFCVRGHSEGVYNRGQDSAGILAFEQCSRNAFVENSVTHGGDGFFGFAGKEALGEVPGPEGFDYATAGCNENLFYGNSFSYAAAHGLELTFSKDNIIELNTFVENAICGIWGGYSRSTTIVNNRFGKNGGMAYGMEGGGVNIEHGSANRIIQNSFTDNRGSIHLWWDNDAELLELPGVKAGYRGVSNNLIAQNRFVHGDEPKGDARPPAAVRFREEPAQDPPMVFNNVYVGNKFYDDPAVELDVGTGRPLLASALATTPSDVYAPQARRDLGVKRPVRERRNMNGRSWIVMNEWGPWEGRSPLLRAETVKGGTHIYKVFGDLGGKPSLDTTGAGEPVMTYLTTSAKKPEHHTIAVTSPRAGVWPYEIPVRYLDEAHVLKGVLVKVDWEVRAFTWDEASDPRTNLGAWRSRAPANPTHPRPVGELNFPFGGGGPRQQPWGAADPDARDRFGLVATTRLPLPAGRWRFSTLSDDGVRVLVNRKPVVENWTWHGPTRDTGVYVQDAAGVADITVEYFEIDGHAVLTLDIAPG